MKGLKPLLDFYINSSIHVALAVFSMAWITLIEFKLDFDKNILLFIFFASITGYNFVKYFGLAKFHHRGLAKRLRVIQVFSFFSFIAMCYFVMQLQSHVLLYIFGLSAVTFLYAIPFLPKYMFMDQQKNLRSIGGLKVYVIALVWSGVTVVLPLLHTTYEFDSEVWLITFQRFIFVIILMLPFEIRDLQYDSLKLSTIPQKIGIKNTKIVGVLLGMLFFFLEFFKDELDSNQIIITLTITIITLLFLIGSKKNRSEYYSSLWVESVPIVWLLLHIIL